MKRNAGERIGYARQYSWNSLVAQLVKNPSAMQETWVRFLAWKDSLEKGKTTHSSILTGEFHGLYSLWGQRESDTTERVSLSLFAFMHWRRKWQPTLVFLPGES